MRKIFIKRLCLTGFVCLGLSACSVAPPGIDVHDPAETTNRQVHAFNKALDQAVVRPVANTYDAVLPDPVEDSVSAFASNLSLPGKIVNNTLQGDLLGAGQNLLRFAINTTAGIGGLFDPSGVMGLNEVDTDFGETLSVWGVPEGAYLELPVFGPSNERDAAGLVVDMILDPLSYVIGAPESTYRTGARVGEILQTRHVLGGQIDGVLYDSADSYAQARLIYLQNRRFALGVDAEESFDDLYADPYIGPDE
ncbi:MAG: VacJ family lipoprotein [Pseudomonadota bacterium]